MSMRAPTGGATALTAADEAEEVEAADAAPGRTFSPRPAPSPRAASRAPGRDDHDLRGRPDRRHEAAPSAPANRVLRVVRPNDLSPRARKRRSRLAAAAVCALIGLGVFATVVFHVVITQNQFRLDSLRDKAQVEQTRYERLRLQVADLESPDRVVAAARDRLGMIQPPKISYLSPPASATPAGATGGAAPAPSAGTKGSWSTVKSQLASHP